MASQEQIDFYNNFVDHFDQQKDNGRNKSFRDWSLKWIRPGCKVLDFGCALGYNSGYLTEQNIDVVGIDISPKCIEIAKERYPKGKWICADVTDKDNLEPHIEEVDFILMSDVIEHVPVDRHQKLFRYLGFRSTQNAAIIASIPNPEVHEESLKNTPQPVEEKLSIPQLLSDMSYCSEEPFNRVISIFLDGKVYYRMVVQKGRR